MLNVFRRYTCLFLSDSEMKAEYEKKREKICDIEEFEAIPDLEDFIFSTVPPEREPLEGPLRMDISRIFIDVKPQLYALPDPLIRWILNLSSTKLRLKLFKSCKNLFTRKRTPFCHQLKIQSNLKNSKFSGESLFIQGGEAELRMLSKLHITNRLHIKYSDIYLTKSIIPKLYKCEARFVEIHQQVWSNKEFEFVIDPSKIESFFFYNGGITYDDGRVAELEGILGRVANASKIQ